MSKKLKYILWAVWMLLLEGTTVQAQNDLTITIGDFSSVTKGTSFYFTAGAPISTSCGNVFFDIQFDPALDISGEGVVNVGAGTIVNRSSLQQTYTLEYGNIPAGTKRLDFTLTGAFIPSTICGGAYPVKVTLRYADATCGSVSNIKNLSIQVNTLQYTAGKILGNGATDIFPLNHLFQISAPLTLGALTLTLNLQGKPFKLIGASRTLSYNTVWNTSDLFNSQEFSFTPGANNSYTINVPNVGNSYVDIILYFQRDVSSVAINPATSYGFDITVSTVDCPHSQTFSSPTFTLSSNSDVAIASNPVVQHSVSDVNFGLGPCNQSRSSSFSEQINNSHNVSDATNLVYELDIDNNIDVTELYTYPYSACPNCLIQKIEAESSLGVTSSIFSPSTPAQITQSQGFSVPADTRKIKITFSQLPKHTSFYMDYHYTLKSSVTTTVNIALTSTLSSGYTSSYSFNVSQHQVGAPGTQFYSSDYGMGKLGSTITTGLHSVSAGDKYAFRVYVYMGGSVSNAKFVYTVNPYLVVDRASFKYAIASNSYDFQKSQFTDFSQLNPSISTSQPTISTDGFKITIDNINYQNTCGGTYFTIYYEATIGPFTPTDEQKNDCDNCVIDNRTNSPHYNSSTSWQVPPNGFQFAVSSSAVCGTTTPKQITAVASKNYSLSVVYDNSSNNTATNPVLIVSNAFPSDKYGSNVFSTCPLLSSTSPSLPALITGAIVSQTGSSSINSSEDFQVYYTNDANPCLFANADGSYPKNCNTSTVWSVACTSGSGPLFMKLVPKDANYKLLGYSKLSFQLSYTLSVAATLNSVLNYSVIGTAQYGLYHNVYVGGEGDDDLDKNLKSPTTIKVGATSTCDISPCTNCLSSFAPIPGSTYYLSGWVRESSLPAVGTQSYSSVVQLVYEGSITPSTDATAQFSPVGAIIDGWQRIEGTFTVPIAATSISVNLVNKSTGDAYFDDIRIHPRDASMKSFVYDPTSRRLTAELDGNNYATFYDYDEEGALIRVRKETERGIMTIQESRSRQYKKAPLTDQQ